MPAPKMLTHLEGANKAQALAIEHASGPIQVLAGPGSGKTYLTIRRIRHLICHHGISPAKILVITFTKAAAAEMQQRFYVLTERNYKEVAFGTFHAVYFQMIKQSLYRHKKLTIASYTDKCRYLKHVLSSYQELCHKEGENFFEKLLKEISKEKNGMRKVSEDSGVSEEVFLKVYREYCLLMEEEGKVDFDDMVLLCERMLEKDKEILTYWQQKYSHILVDEFQDISMLQYRILKKLALPENNLFVVGDDDQSIYGFRGAGPGIMQSFIRDYPEAVQVVLETNYRCGKNIVAASQILIKENKERFSKKIESAVGETDEVTIKKLDSKEEQYNYLIQRFQKKEPQELSQYAVIGRTNAQLSALARRLTKEKIPFTIKEKTDNLFGSEIAKDILAYLHFAHDCYAQNLEEKNRLCSRDSLCRQDFMPKGKRSDLLRIMNKPSRYIPRKILTEEQVAATELVQFYRENMTMSGIVKCFCESLKRIALLRPYLAIDYIRKGIGYEDYVKDELRNRSREQEEWEEVRERLEELQQSALSYRTLAEWEAYISEYTQKTELRQKERQKTEGVNLLTMHNSKGLEFEQVFLPNINRGSIPSRKAVLPAQIEEERRLLYVAMTRAKNRLEILCYGEASFLIQGLLFNLHKK